MLKSLKIMLPVVACLLLLAAAVGGCGSGSGTAANKSMAQQQPKAQPQPQTAANADQAQVPAEQPVAPEKNPTGDIPDSQAFIKYSSATGGYGLEVPEGWARSESGTEVSFVDKLDGLRVSVSKVSAPPTVDSVRGSYVAGLEKTGRAVYVQEIKSVNLPGGEAVLVRYQSNSDPDAVTGKKVRLENESYLFYSKGRQATLTLWAPLGADNVDQWKRMSESFRWQ